MKFSARTYIIISVVSFIILAAVQLFLVYNTYQLKNERYYFAEKGALKESYHTSIIGDKLFPGGQKIIDTFIFKNLQQLERTYQNNKTEFEILKQKIVDSIVQDLRGKQSVNQFLQQYKRDKRITDSFEYALLLTTLDIIFEKRPFVSLFSKNQKYELIDMALQEKDGIRIGGALKKINKQNEVSAITVSSERPYNYRCAWALYVEPMDRHTTIMGQMALILILSLLSIVIIITLFFVTFRNWLRQRKLSDIKSDFINNVTHELHTPLAAITVANKSLQNEKIIEKKDNIRPLTDIIQRQSERLTMLISQVLDITGADKPDLNKKEYSLHKLLDEILLDYRLKASGNNLNLTFDKGAEKDTVMLDKFHFISVVLNLLDNAVKYNTNSVKNIVVSTMNDEYGLKLIISDNGTGMRTETIHKVFDKFYRNTNAMNGHQVKGLGLGLYYVKKSIRAHQWQINVKSKPGEGSSFIIDILPQNQET